MLQRLPSAGVDQEFFCDSYLGHWRSIQEFSSRRSSRSEFPKRIIFRCAVANRVPSFEPKFRREEINRRLHSRTDLTEDRRQGAWGQSLQVLIRNKNVGETPRPFSSNLPGYVGRPACLCII